METTRQRLYRLCRVCSAANTSSDLIAFITPVKDFEDSQSIRAAICSYVPQNYFLKGETAVPFGPAAVRGEVIRRKLEAYWGCSRFFLQSQIVISICTYVAIQKAPD